MAGRRPRGSAPQRTAPGGTGNDPGLSTSVIAGALRLAPYWASVLRRSWRAGVVSSLLSPLLYVVAMGVLLGGFVAADPSELEGAGSYLAFVVPGLLAAHAMQLTMGDMSFPVMAALKWDKTYYAMHAAPIGVASIMLAHVAFAVLRACVACALFVAVLIPFDVFANPLAVPLVLAAQALIASAFAAAVYAFSAGLTSEWSFNLLFRLGMIPMFLFSGAFFPVANLPEPLEFLARLTPLWHGVDLTRMLALDTLDVRMALLHVAYLGAMVGLGGWWGVRRLRSRLVS